jgi:hypothetical protein
LKDTVLGRNLRREAEVIWKEDRLAKVDFPRELQKMASRFQDVGSALSSAKEGFGVAPQTIVHGAPRR